MDKISHQNWSRLAMDLLHGKWLLHNAESYFPLAMTFLAGGKVYLENCKAESEVQMRSSGSSASGESKKDSKVLIYPIHTVLTKYDTSESYGAVSIATELLSLAMKEDIVGVVLDIDSPGGSCNAIAPIVMAIDKIKGAGKPIIVHCDLCASAAYWIASRCDAIFMDNNLSEIGSIGAYCSVIDDRYNKATGTKFLDIYAKESKDKNIAYREALEGRYELMQKELSEIVGEFHSAVKAGRPGLNVNADGVMTGAMFSPVKAIEVGLADGMASLEQCVENIFVRAEYNNK